MPLDARLKKLSPALSAKERAILVLGSLKERTPEDESWRRTMPPAQVNEFNRLIRLMNGVNGDLALFISLLEESLCKLELRLAWLVDLVLWGEQVERIRAAFAVFAREPITRSEYDAQLEQARSEWVPVEELAELLVEDHEGWAEADLEEVEGWDEPVVSDAAWDRVHAEKVAELRGLVSKGALRGRGRGRRLRVQEGTFNDHFGRESVAVPERALRYRVLPDSEADDVQAEARRLAEVYQALDDRPFRISDQPEAPNVREALAAALRETLSGCFASCWAELRACEIVLDEVAGEFDGVDPLRGERRELLMATREKLKALAEQLVYLDVDVQAREPDDELLAIMRRLVQRWT